MKKKWINFLLLGLTTISCAAQTGGYKFYSKLDSVQMSGFYNIPIVPALNAHIKTDYSDVRIVNDSGVWIPHIVRFAKDGLTENKAIVPVEILKKENSGSITSIVLKNNSTFLSEFDILIKNTAATRTAKISGSDNQSDWFVIQDSTNLSPLTRTGSDTAKYHIEFPSCNYKFYKISINNKTFDPVNILSVGYTFSLTVYNSNFTISDNPACTIKQYDSGRLTYISVLQKQSYHFDHFRIGISKAKYFYRLVDMFIPYDGVGSFSNPGALFTSFYISNNSALEFNIPFCNAGQFYLVIHNEDNPPLKIDEVKTSGDLRFVTAYLEKGNSYRLLMGNMAATMPDYDLSKLNISFSDSISFLKTGNVTAFNKMPEILEPKKNNKWMLWSAIAAALLILLFFTYKMLKEVDKRKTT